MAEKTGIAWTRSTFNPWIGCTKVGPGCDHCYAETLDKRMRYGGGEHWGSGVPRLRTSFSNWKQPLTWNSRAARGERPWRVFCASLADVFDNEVPAAWRADLWHLITRCSHLDWLIVTKRIGNVAKMVPAEWIQRGFPSSVRLMITVCDQEEADRDIPKLLELPCKNGISYEPALGPIDWRRFFLLQRAPDLSSLSRVPEAIPIPKSLLQWIIVGGESTQASGKARPFPIHWARDTAKQCKRAGVPVFVKQLGSNLIERNDAGFEGDGDDQWPAGSADKVEHNPFGYLEEYQGAPIRVHLADRAGADPAEWPEDLRIQEFPT